MATLDGDRVAVLFSGGTDSTAASALLTEQFRRIDLLSYTRAGFCNIEHTRYNAGKLAERFPETTFVHRILETTKLARHVTEHKRYRYFLKYGFFTLQSCGFCALLNHIGTLAYCLRNGIAHTADGITYDWPFFPGHMDKVIELLKAMHSEFGVTYHTPVIHCDVDRSLRYADKLDGPTTRREAPESAQTTGKILRHYGLSKTDNYKGTQIDRKAQARCYQFVLPNLFIYWMYRGPERWEKYEATVVEYFGHLIEDSTALVRRYFERGEHSELFTFLDEPDPAT